MAHSLVMAGATILLRATAEKPALQAPPGETSDLVHQKNSLWKFNVVAQTACMVVAGTLFFLRCFIRLGGRRMPRQWILEDCKYSSITLHSHIELRMQRTSSDCHVST
jgi:hypothetical protein